VLFQENAIGLWNKQQGAELGKSARWKPVWFADRFSYVKTNDEGLIIKGEVPAQQKGEGNHAGTS